MVNQDGFFCARRVAMRTDYFAALIMYRIVCMKQPPFLLPLFIPYKNDRPFREPRKDLELHVALTNCELQSFQIKYANFGNKIPPCIRYLPSFSQFKKSVKTYLLKFETNCQYKLLFILN